MSQYKCLHLNRNVYIFRIGRKCIPAKVLNRKFKEDEILVLVGNIINFYECNANKQERFANLIERLEFEKVQQQILNM